MLREFKAAVNLTYQCDVCKRDIMSRISLIEGESLLDFSGQVIDTMNAEGASICTTWVCPDCVRE